jgi:hypothetical protein
MSYASQEHRRLIATYYRRRILLKPLLKSLQANLNRARERDTRVDKPMVKPRVLIRRDMRIEDSTRGGHAVPVNEHLLQ